MTIFRNRSIASFAGMLAAASAAVLIAAPAHADKLDDIINSGVVKCGVMLDFPPLGFYNDKHEPVGYSVDWCHDMASALGVKAQVIDTPSAERIPALISGRVDVSVANASNTLERAKTVLFTIPYHSDPWTTVAKKDSSIESFDDLKGKKVGDARGAVPGNLFKKFNEETWSGASELVLYGDDASKVLALEQGKIDGFITNLSNARQVVDKYTDFAIVGEAPFLPDVTAMMVKRGEFGLQQWLNLFIYQQVREGRYDAIYQKWLGGEKGSNAVEAPSLTVEGVYY